MPKSKADPRNRVCFWLPELWRNRMLDVVARDGRGQGEFIRAAVTSAIERAEANAPRKK